MLENKEVEALTQSMKRIFALKVNRTTWREVQNIVMNVTQGNQEEAGTLLEALFTGRIKDSLVAKDAKEKLQRFIDEWGVHIRLAREINEKGDFVGMISSDLLTNQDRIAFLNRISRVDREEFHFITDPESTLNMLLHFVNRLSELQKQPGGKEALSAHTNNLRAIQTQMNTLVEEIGKAKI